MPFMKGRAPIRRTLEYLKSSNLVLKDRVKIFTVNYNVNSKHHEGARDFVFWHLAQLQYNNPQVQVNTFKNLTPTPFIRVFFENGEEALVDLDSRPRKEIHNHVRKVFCKTDVKLAEEARERQSRDNPANFGWGVRTAVYL